MKVKTSTIIRALVLVSLLLLYPFSNSDLRVEVNGTSDYLSMKFSQVEVKAKAIENKPVEQPTEQTVKTPPANEEQPQEQTIKVPPIKQEVRSQTASVSTLGTNQDKAATSPWTALTSLSLTANDYIFVCTAADAAGTGVSAETNVVTQDTDDSSMSGTYTNLYLGTTFTMPSSGYLNTVTLSLQKYGSPGGVLNIDLYATTSSLPSGVSLQTTSITLASITTKQNYTATFLAPVLLNASEYAIVVSGVTGDVSNCIYWFQSATNPLANGAACYNASGYWVQVPSQDFRFIIGTRIALTADITGDNAGNAVVKIWSGKVTVTGTAYYVVITNTSTAKACTAYKCSGLASSSALDKYNSKTGNAGTDTDSDYTGTLSQADELVICVSGVEDEVDDANGTWTSGAGYVSGNTQFNATNGGGDTSNIQVHSVAAIVTATTSLHGVDAGHDSSDWASAIASYKAINTITTEAVSAITATTATGNGTVVIKSSALTEKGICYNTTGSPTTADATFHDHSDTTGAFTENMTGLTEGQIYHTKAYMIDGSGTFYGDEADFYTLPGNPTSLAADDVASTQMDLTWTKGAGGDKTLVRLGQTKDIITTTSPSSSNFQAITWFAQTFTTTSAYTIDTIILDLSENGTLSTDVTVSIRATSAGLPTGEDLTTGTIVGSQITAAQATFFVGVTPYALSNSTMYAIVIRTSGGAGGNSYNLWCDGTNPYASGILYESGNSGSSWTTIGGGVYDATCTTYIVGAYPASITDGYQCYLDTGTGTTILRLTTSTTYKFRAWAVDTTPNPDNYSTSTSDVTQATTSSFDISNDPSSKAFSIVTANTTYYAKGTAPNNPVVDGDCTFAVTNNGVSAIDIDIHGHSFTGGVGWTLTSGAPGSNTVRITTYTTGMNPASGIVVTTGDQELVSNLAATAHIHWDFKFETGTFTDGVAKEGILTLTARTVT